MQTKILRRQLSDKATGYQRELDAIKKRFGLGQGRRIAKGIPTPGDVHVNRPLTNLSVAYAQSLDKFQADNLAPIIPSDNRSDLYFIFTKDYWFRDEMKVRGIGAEAVDAGYGITTGSFACTPYAVRKAIPDMVRANEDAPLNSDRSAMRFVTRLERIRRELAFASVVFASGTWTTNITGNSSASNISGGTLQKWSISGSTPIEDVQAMCTLVELLTGYRPNSLAMGQQVWDVLTNHAELIDRLKYGGQINNTLAHITTDLCAAVMNLEEIVVMSAVYNTAPEGGTFSGSYIAGNNALLQYKNPDSTIEDVTAVRTFTWRRYLSADVGFRIKKYRLEQYESDYVEMQSAFIHKVIAPDLGVWITPVV
jgi:hypothetical protein